LFSFLERNKVILVYLPLIIYWIVLLALTSFPVEYIPSTGVSDKIEHYFAYVLLAGLLFFTLSFQEKFKALKRRPFLFTMIISVVYGAADELHQLFVPGRICDIIDWIADFLGVITALLLIYFLKQLDKVKQGTEAT
jgi:VanZ family protein